MGTCTADDCCCSPVSTSLLADEVRLIGCVFVAGILIGYITWKRPRVALVMAGAGAAVIAPYIGFAAAALNRWQKFTENLVEACQTVDVLEQDKDVEIDLLKDTGM